MKIGLGPKQPRYGPRMLSGWERFQSWQNARKSAVQKFLVSNADVSASLTAAWNFRVAGEAKLAAQAALTRITASADSKLDQTKATLDKLI